MDDINFASNADDNTLYTTGNDIEDVIFKLQNQSKILFQCFMDNKMKANTSNVTLSIVSGGFRHCGAQGQKHLRALVLHFFINQNYS